MAEAVEKTADTVSIMFGKNNKVDEFGKKMRNVRCIKEEARTG